MVIKMKLCNVYVSNDKSVICKYCGNEDLRIIISMNINNLNNSFNEKFEKEK